MTWEYKVLSDLVLEDNSVLQTLGAEGWELVCVVSYTGHLSPGTTRVRFYFKRAIV